MTAPNRRDNIAREIERAAEARRAAQALVDSGLHADSVSRAYYATYHLTRALLYSRGIEPKSHAGAIHLFNVEFVRPSLLPSSFNRILSGLQRTRELADYDAAVRFSAEDARANLDSAREFEAAVLDLLGREGWLEMG